MSSKLNYILTPEFITDSSSDSALTWPPTHFSIRMVCTVTDVSGAVVLKKEVVGQGNAEWSEFKRNFALSAQRATEDMLKKLQAMLAAAPELGGVASAAVARPSMAAPVGAPAAGSAAAQTTSLKDLQGLLPAAQ